MVSEFIPKLSHSSSSPNFSSFNNIPPPGHPPPNSSAANHLGGKFIEKIYGEVVTKV